MCVEPPRLPLQGIDAQTPPLLRATLATGAAHVAHLANALPSVALLAQRLPTDLGPSTGIHLNIAL